MKLDFHNVFSFAAAHRAYTIFLLQPKLYQICDKIKDNFDLRITGDIDEPDRIYFDFSDIKLEELEEWINLASELGTLPPILFVTNTDYRLFEVMKQIIHDIDAKVVVGFHGIHHLHYSRFREAEKEIVAGNPNEWFRFPYLDFNMKLLETVSEHYKYESSIISETWHPFKIGNMVEYPITPPSDTFYRNKPVTKYILEYYRQMIDKSIRLERTCTFLFHPNSWTVNFLKELKKYV